MPLSPITYSFRLGQRDIAEACRQRLECDGYEVVLLIADDGVIIVSGRPPSAHDALIVYGGFVAAFIALLVPVSAWIGALVVLP